jgi:hypothetical protein
MGDRVKAVRVNEFAGSEQLRLEDVPSLIPGPGEVVTGRKRGATLLN